jgi:hypothetical protein
VAAISNFLFYNPDTINLHVLMVLSIGGIANAMLLPVFFSIHTDLVHAMFQMETANYEASE